MPANKQEAFPAPNEYAKAIEKFRQACEEAYDRDLNREDMAEIVEEVNDRLDGENAEWEGKSDRSRPPTSKADRSRPFHLD